MALPAQASGRSGASPERVYDRILVATDGSEPAAAALEYALAVATAHDATLHVLGVADTDRVDAAGTDALVAAAERTVDEAAARATARDVSVVTAVCRGEPHASIVEYAGRAGVGCVVVATTGRRDLGRYLLGSTTERVIETAPAPVLALTPDRHPSPTYPPARVLVPVDGSPGADRALATGIEIAAATGATLHPLHVVETGRLGPDTGPARAAGEAIVATAAERAATAAVETETAVVENAEPARAIGEYATATGIDLAVVGTGDGTAFDRYVLGGVAAKLVRTAPTPVAWVRAPGPDRS